MKRNDKRKRIYVFDIDETLLCVQMTNAFLMEEFNKVKPTYTQEEFKDLSQKYSVNSRLHPKFFNEDGSSNKKFLTESKHNPYESFNKGYSTPFTDRCYTLHRDRMKNIMQSIIDNGDDIAFITAGKMPQKGFETFLDEEYDITSLDLNNKFKSNFKNKSQPFIELIRKTSKNNKYTYPYSKAVFIDNKSSHINEILSWLSFKQLRENTPIEAIYAANNRHDQYTRCCDQWLDKLEADLAERKELVQERLAHEKAKEIRRQELEKERLDREKAEEITRQESEIQELIKKLTKYASALYDNKTDKTGLKNVNDFTLIILGLLAEIENSSEIADPSVNTQEGNSLSKTQDDKSNWHEQIKKPLKDLHQHRNQTAKYALIVAKCAICLTVIGFLCLYLHAKSKKQEFSLFKKTNRGAMADKIIKTLEERNELIEGNTQSREQNNTIKASQKKGG